MFKEFVGKHISKKQIDKNTNKHSYAPYSKLASASRGRRHIPVTTISS
jgi:hypothetical protein